MFGSSIDYVVENAPCDVAVYKTSGTIHPTRVLVLIAGNPHEALVEKITAALIAANGGVVTLLGVATTEDGREQTRDVVEERQRALSENGLDAETAVVSNDDVANAVVSFATEGGFDTLVLGAAEEGVLHRAIFGDVPELAGEAFDGEVVLVRRHRPVRSFVGRVARKWVSGRSQRN